MQKNDIKYKVYFITGGGTGGHIYPAVSVINELKLLGANNIFYIGNENNPEYQIAQDMGINFLNVPITGMPRTVGFSCIVWAIKLLASFILCTYYAIKYGPNVVFATGGYVSAPMVMCAEVFKIPYVMHDSDAYPGIVTRRFSDKAAYVNLAFEEAKEYLKKSNCVVLGNPVRRAFFETDKQTSRKMLRINDNEFVILIMGGSQGARTINEAAVSLIEKYKDSKSIKIIMQTGKKNYDNVKNNVTAKLGSIPDNLILMPYFDEMEVPVTASDIVVSRAGSLSISEIVSAKLPSVLIPYPYAAADHQRINAKSMEKSGASIYIEDADLTGQKLTQTIESLIENKEKLKALKDAAVKLKKDHPSEKITELVLECVKKKK